MGSLTLVASTLWVIAHFLLNICGFISLKLFTAGAVAIYCLLAKQKKIPVFRVTQPYLNLLVKLTGEGKMPFKMHKIYSCPMKTHHSSDVHICGLLKAVQNCVIYNYYLGQMRCFRTQILIPVTRFTHDVTPASKVR